MSKLTENSLYNIKGQLDIAGVNPVVVREPTVGKWYVGASLVGADNNRELYYGDSARYLGDGRWYSASAKEMTPDMYIYDYLQELS